MLADEAARHVSRWRAWGSGLRRTQVEALIRLAGFASIFRRLHNPMQIGFFTQQLLEAINFRAARASELKRCSRASARARQERAELMARVAPSQTEPRARVGAHAMSPTSSSGATSTSSSSCGSRSWRNKPFGAMSEEELARCATR